MKSTYVLWQYKPTLTNRSFFDMIPAYKGPWCRSRRQQGSWKQGAVVFWYCIYPAGRVPGYNGGTRKGYLCGINHQKFGCSSSSLQSSFAMSRQVMKRSNTRLFIPLPPHCISSTTVCRYYRVVRFHLSALLLFRIIYFALTTVGWAERKFEADGAGIKCGG